MMKQYLNVITLWLTTLAYVVAAVNPAYGAMVCSGPNNHVALEFGWALGGRCTDSDASHSSTPGVSDAYRGAGCEDVPLLEVGLRTQASQPTTPIAALQQTPLVSTHLQSLARQIFSPGLSRSSTMRQHISLEIHTRNLRTIALLV